MRKETMRLATGTTPVVEVRENLGTGYFNLKLLTLLIAVAGGAGCYEASAQVKPKKAVCGDGRCSLSETTASCERDCGELCGDGVCGSTKEDRYNCGKDCGKSCGDGQCGPGETTQNCSKDCGSQCGDKVCNGNETAQSCPGDCIS